jgi:uncharacterized membrane protein
MIDIIITIVVTIIVLEILKYRIDKYYDEKKKGRVRK